MKVGARLWPGPAPLLQPCGEESLLCNSVLQINKSILNKNSEPRAWSEIVLGPNFTDTNNQGHVTYYLGLSYPVYKMGIMRSTLKEWF